MSIFLKNDIDNVFNEVIKDLKSIFFAENGIFLDLDKSNIKLKSKLQSYLNKKYDSGLHQTIYQFIIDYCFLAEKFSPGGFDKTLNFIFENVEKNEVNRVSDRPKIENLNRLIEEIVEEKSLQLLILNALELAGFAGRISIEKNGSNSSYVEVINGYTFEHETSFIKKTLKILKPRIICIDGYVESVAEINLLFEDAVRTKYPLILLSRGYHDDVLSTIKVNNERGSFNITPLKVPFSIEGINTLVDISYVIDSTPVSSNMGQLISSVRIDDCVQVQEAIISNNSIIIKNDGSLARVNNHIQDIISRMNSASDVSDLQMKRIKSMSNNNVIISMPDDSTYVYKCQKIDLVLRSIRSMIDHGIFEDGGNITLAATDVAAKLYSNKLKEALKKLGAASLC